MQIPCKKINVLFCELRMTGQPCCHSISTQSSSAHVEERDRIPKPVSTGVENGCHCSLIV